MKVRDIMKRHVVRPGGISSTAFVKTFTRICETPSVEPEIDFTDTYVSG